MNVIEVFTFCTINTANEKLPWLVELPWPLSVATAMPIVSLSSCSKMISLLNGHRLSLQILIMHGYFVVTPCSLPI